MLRFSTTLQKATFNKRYKRFFADVMLEDGSIVTAHCPNTGSMASCLIPGATVWLSPSINPNRKLKWTWELVETEQGYIGINTSLPNKVVEAAVQSNMIPDLAGYAAVQREVKYGQNSRIDLLLRDPQRGLCYVEVKNTTWLAEDYVQFPDSVTERGQKHLQDLADVVTKGHRGVIFFFVNRSDGKAFRPADAVDPTYGRLLRKVCRQGVEALAYRAVHSTFGIQIGEPVSIILD